MTRVNVLLPLFQTSLRTNNSQIITEILNQKYGITPAHVFWLSHSHQEYFECVVRLPNLPLTFEGVLEEIDRRKAVEETVKKLQVDLFNVLKKHEELFTERKNIIPLERLREEIGNENEDSEDVSLKIEEKPRPKQTAAHSEQQMMTAIWELTRENLKLKDAVIFYEAQLELLKGNDHPPSMLKPK